MLNHICRILKILNVTEVVYVIGKFTLLLREWVVLNENLLIVVMRECCKYVVDLFVSGSSASAMVCAQDLIVCSISRHSVCRKWERFPAVSHHIIELLLLIDVFLGNHKIVEGIELVFIDAQIWFWDSLYVGSICLLPVLKRSLHLHCIALDLITDVV